MRNGQTIHKRKDMKLERVRFLILAAGAFACAATVKGQVQGEVWSLYPQDGFSAVAANLPAAGTPGVTFNLPYGPLAFDSNGSQYYTIGSFLGTGSGYNIVYGSGYAPNSTMDETIMNIAGSILVTSGQQFTITHDDGVTFTINGQTVISSPSPTSATPSSGTFSGAPGTYPFELIYAEVDGAPAVLTSNFAIGATPVPEPTTMAAGALMLLPFGMSVLRTLRQGRREPRRV
jgi:hypothetical protein